jgi:hypothetical protein
MQSQRFMDIPKLIIDPEFQDLIPVMTPDEKAGLEKSILEDGCRDPLVLWGETLVDGHKRFEICEKNEKEFKTVQKNFESREQAKLWIIANQLSRRNLTPKQASYLRGLRYNIEKKSPGQPLEGDQKEHQGKTADRLAKEFGVSPATVRRDAKFAEKVNELPSEEKAEILIGKRKSTKGELATPPRTISPLDQLKRWWGKASQEERQEFIAWAQNPAEQAE